MTTPLALIYYQNPLTGNQLVNRLQDHKYRIQTVQSVKDLEVQARVAGVMLVLVDVEGANPQVTVTIRELRANPATQHIPIVAFSGRAKDLASAQEAGCTLAVESTVLISHLEAVLEQALRVD